MSVTPDATIMQGLRGPWWTSVLLAAGLLRFAMAVQSGLANDRGDFFATMPGAYAETLNPALWHSEDLSRSWAFQRRVYLYGPTQYLTLAPAVYLFDTYRTLARALLPVYAVLILLTAWMLWKSFIAIRPVRGGLAATVGATLLFFPILQALLQREFEIVILFVSTAALYCAVRRRTTITGALVAYMAWFKLFPLLWVPYLLLRRWWRAALAFAAVSVIILGTTHLWLGLGRFESVWDVSARFLTARSSTAALCAEWTPAERRFAIVNHTFADVPWALCRFADWWPVVSAPAIYAVILALTSAVFLITFWRLERGGPLDAGDEGWRRLLEISTMAIASSVFVHAQYYYLGLLIIPLGALLLWYMSAPRPGWVRPALWTVAYVTLGAFVLPLSLLSKLIGTEFWALYMRHGLYFIGEILILALVLWEYATIGLRPPAAPAVAAEAAA